MSLKERKQALRDVAERLIDGKPIARDDRRAVGEMLREVLDEMDRLEQEAWLAMGDE